MHKRLGLTLFAGLAIFISACSGGGATSAPASAGSAAPSTEASVAPSSEASAPASAEASTAASPSAETLTCTTKIKVGLVTDVGRVNDKGFNQSAFEGMKAAEAAAPTCFETDFVETQSQSDYPSNIAGFTDSGSNVVIGVGFLLGDALGDASKANTDVKFISVDGVPGAGHDESWSTNGESLFFAEDQAGYMAGVLAASLSKSDHIGVVGGLVVVPPVERFVEGYIDGAKSVKPAIVVDFVYTTSFVDPPQGNSAAKQMIDKGADVIFAAGGLTGSGALEAACQADGVLAIGVDTDQYETLPSVQKCIVSSATKNVAGAVRDSLLRIAADKFTPGFHTDDASTAGIGLAPFHDQEASVSAEVKTLLDSTFAGLADGSIVPKVTIDAK
ncbi:MAG: BMP family ABC transporter substrate-binding protein [Candidatus Limnocylindrales bacterium]